MAINAYIGGQGCLHNGAKRHSNDNMPIPNPRARNLTEIGLP